MKIKYYDVSTDKYRDIFMRGKRKPSFKEAKDWFNLQDDENIVDIEEVSLEEVLDRANNKNIDEWNIFE